MSIEDIVSLNISLQSATLTKPGFGTGLLAAYHTVTGNRVDEVGQPSELVDLGFPVTGTGSWVYRAAAKYFSQNPRPRTLKIGRRALAFTKAVRLYPLNTDAGFVYSWKVTGTDGVDVPFSYTVQAGDDEADIAFKMAELMTDSYRTCTAEADDNLTELAGHGFTADTAVKYKNTGGALPTGLVQGTVYYVIASGLTSSKFKVSETVGGAEVNLTTDGTGTNSVARDVDDVAGVAAVHTGSDDYLTITASAAGDLFDLIDMPHSAYLMVRDVTPDPGIATDLAAILTADDIGWYGLVLDSAGEAEVEAAAAWTEANGKLFLASSMDSEMADSTVTNDLGSDIQDNSYARTSVQIYTRSLLGHLDAGIFGKLLPEKPGYATFDFKTIAAVPVDVLRTGQTSALKAKNVGWYTNVGGSNITQRLKTGSGEWLDVVIFLDWLRVEIKFGVLEALIANKRIPFTDPGIETIVSVLERIFRSAEETPKNPLGPIANGSWTITRPAAKDVASSNKRARVLPDVKFAFTLAGAIHAVEITGSVSE